MNERRCPRCGKTKPLAKFMRGAVRGRGGLIRTDRSYATCNECKNNAKRGKSVIQRQAEYQARKVAQRKQGGTP